MVYTNKDGLTLNFGTAKATNSTTGEYKTFGELREIEINLDLTTLTSTPVILDNGYKFPVGVFYQEVVVVSNTAATGTGATLDIGLQQEDRATEIDYNGFVAALPLTSIDAVGEQTTLTPGVTYAGALMGTATSAIGYVTANYNTAAFTAGKARIRIRYYAATPITQ